MQGRLPVTNLCAHREPRRSVEIRKHPMGPVPKWGLYFYWGRGITRVGFNRPLYPAHVDASDSSTFRVVFPELWRAFF